MMINRIMMQQMPSQLNRLQVNMTKPLQTNSAQQKTDDRNQIVTTLDLQVNPKSGLMPYVSVNEPNANSPLTSMKQREGQKKTGLNLFA
jgi:hypothetical protein